MFSGLSEEGDLSRLLPVLWGQTILEASRVFFDLCTLDNKQKINNLTIKTINVARNQLFRLFLHGKPLGSQFADALHPVLAEPSF